MTNKLIITQEEFDKKVETLMEGSNYENNSGGNIDKERFREFIIANLKERYDIK